MNKHKNTTAVVNEYDGEDNTVEESCEAEEDNSAEKLANYKISDEEVCDYNWVFIFVSH